jgi:hypothetical protein
MAVSFVFKDQSGTIDAALAGGVALEQLMRSAMFYLPTRVRVSVVLQFEADSLADNHPQKTVIRNIVDSMLQKQHVTELQMIDTAIPYMANAEVSGQLKTWARKWSGVCPTVRCMTTCRKIGKSARYWRRIPGLACVRCVVDDASKEDNVLQGVVTKSTFQLLRTQPVRRTHVLVVTRGAFATTRALCVMRPFFTMISNVFSFTMG